MLEQMQLKAHATQKDADPTLKDIATRAKEVFATERNISDKQTCHNLAISANPPAAIKRDTPWPDQSTKDPKVTLAMIVRNEDAHIAECLESMKDHVDEIVIVDTGSTDKTVEICERFGAKIFHHPWEDSFSVARNFAISHVETPWLIQLDADEIMEKAHARQVRDQVRAAHKTTANLVHMVLINKAKGSDEEMSVINTGKIMRVIPSLHFVNRVHNKLICPGDIIQSSLTIYHHGYALPDQDVMAKKKDRTTRLLLIQADEQPDDPETFHYLAIQHLRMDDFHKAIWIGTKAADLWAKHDPDSQLRLLSLHVVAMANYQLGSKGKDKKEQEGYFNEAIKYSNIALGLYPDYLDSNCLLSSVYFAMKDHQNCFIHAERYLGAAKMLKSDSTKSLVIPLMSLKHEWMVCLQLAINFFEQADSEKAIHMVGMAEALLPPDQKYKVTWGVFKYMIQLGDTASLKNAESIYKVGFRP